MADNQRYFTLLTDKGKYKLARAAADKGEIKLSHFAIGDGGGKEVNPLPSATSLVREVWRGQLDSVIIDPKNPAAVIVNAIIPHDVGGFWMREFGLFDIEGDMLVVVKPTPDYKATSAEGQLEDIFYEFQLVIGEQAEVVVLVDPSILWATREYVETRRISAQQMANTPWLPVKALDVAVPPSSNSIGDTYVVSTSAKGDWQDKSGQLAEWNGKSWNFILPRDGHGIGLPDGSIYIRINGKYVLLTDIFDKRYSKFPTPPAYTFYVIGPSGNDKNSGLAPTPAEGFATIQGAVEALYHYMTHGTITVKIAPGTYDSVTVRKSTVTSWRFEGDLTNAERVKIVAADVAGKSTAVSVKSNADVTLAGITLVAVTSCVGSVDGTINLENCNLNLVPDAKGIECYGGSVGISKKMKVTGKGDIVFLVAEGGNIHIGHADRYNEYPVDLTFNNVTATGAVFLARGGSNIVVEAQVVKFIGVPTGVAYVVANNAVLNSCGAGLGVFPGTKPGYVLTGGQAG